MFTDIPDSRCQSQYRGYAVEGEYTSRNADEEETISAGEAYSIEPVHNVTVELGTTIIEFSPIGGSPKTLKVASDAVESAKGMD